jgi:hypothetical protein
MAFLTFVSLSGCNKGEEAASKESDIDKSQVRYLVGKVLDSVEEGEAVELSVTLSRSLVKLNPFILEDGKDSVSEVRFELVSPPDEYYFIDRLQGQVSTATTVLLFDNEGGLLWPYSCREESRLDIESFTRDVIEFRKNSR